ncbi:MAG: LysR family transcriptional regulator [Oscillospiraceae bacterium]|nr:LysR family transcriptional regulator [Oscillospiraceae bacterium]
MANYEHYKIFCKIVECSSISKAANQLYISQPAVSLAVKQLEISLNAKLFFRTQKGVKLTTEGATLYSYVKQGCTLISVGEEKLKELGELQAGEVNVGASEMTLRFFLLPLIEKFHKDFPSVKIKITNAPTPETLQHLKEGLIDFGVVSGPANTDSPGIDFKSVKSVKEILVAGKNFGELKEKQKVPAADLRKYPFIMLEKGTSTRSYIEKYLKENGAEINPEIELAANDLVVEFIKRGMGLGFILEEFVRRELENGELFKIDLAPEFPPRSFCIATHSHIPLATAAKKMLEYNDGSFQLSAERGERKELTTDN